MLVTAQHLNKHNQLKCILDDVSFTINDNDKIALIGINGTGKSTLLKMIAGIEDYQGTMIKKKDLRIGYLPQEPDFKDTNTVLAQVYDYIDNNILEYEVKSILNKFGITDHYQLIKELSGGQKKRIALAITLLNPCDLLILDEPTNHLDNDMIEYLEKFLIRFNKAIFMVTHDRYFLERITNKIFELDRCKIYEYEANYSKFLELKEIREEVEMNTQRKRKLFLKKELEWVRAGVQARTTKSKDRLQRFEQLSAIKDRSVINNVEMISISSRLGKKTIELNDVSMSFGNKYLFEPFSYHFKRYDRIGILGMNGAGKSTLLNIITQSIKPASGYVEIGETIKFGYFKQMHEDMDKDMRVIDYISKEGRYVVTSEGELSAKDMCERFLFDSSMQYTPIKRLSGGEKRRLYLLKILMSAPNVLILDEPTNDLDITTLAILEDYLDSFDGIIITVSHDRYFLDRVCDHLFIIKDQKIHYHIGGYSETLDIKDTLVKTEPVKKDTRVRVKKIKLSYNEIKELEHLESHLPKLEERLKEIDNEMNGLTDFDKISSLSNERNEIEEELESGELRLLELLEKQEQADLNK